MVLTTHPFHPVTGDLLPAHRDAYLRGDLSRSNRELVDAYLKAYPESGDEALQRFHIMQQQGHTVRPVGWLQHQFEMIRTEPARFRQRAAVLAAAVMLAGGAVFAGEEFSNETPGAPVALAADGVPDAELLADLATTSAVAARMTTISGRILDENGRPLAGATVLDKVNGRGVSTDASGSYKLLIPANRASHVQFAYGGYSEDEVMIAGRAGTHNVTLVPKAKSKTLKRRWWLF